MHGEQGAHHLAGDPDAEDGDRVVERVVLGNGGVVEDDRGRPHAGGVEEGGCRVAGEEGFADDDKSGVGDADVFLGAALVLVSQWF